MLIFTGPGLRGLFFRATQPRCDPENAVYFEYAALAGILWFLMSTYHALFDVGTHSLLTLSGYAPVVVFLAEAIPDSYCAFSVDRPQYVKDFPVATSDPLQYPQWVWNSTKRTFVETPKELQTDEIRTRSRLAIAKANVVSRIMTDIGFMRMRVSTGVLMQESVYLRKRIEAERLSQLDAEPNSVLEFPYTVQYADYAGVSLRAAADTILLHAKLDDQLLAKTEIMRIRYFDKIRKAATPEDTYAVLDDFSRDAHLNGLV